MGKEEVEVENERSSTGKEEEKERTKEKRRRRRRPKKGTLSFLKHDYLNRPLFFETIPVASVIKLEHRKSKNARESTHDRNAERVRHELDEFFGLLYKFLRLLFQNFRFLRWFLFRCLFGFCRCGLLCLCCLFRRCLCCLFCFYRSHLFSFCRLLCCRLLSFRCF